MTAPDIRHYPARDGLWELLDVRGPAELALDAELRRLRELAREQEQIMWGVMLRRNARKNDANRR